MTDSRTDVLVAAYRRGDHMTKARAVRRLNEEMSAVEISLVLQVSVEVVESMLNER